MLNQKNTSRRAAFVKPIMACIVASLFCIPYVGSAADPTPATSSSASGPPKAPLSAALFAGTSKAPPEEAWKQAAIVTGVRIGREALSHACTVKHVGEWVRIQCNNLSTARADLLAGEKRDLTLFKTADVGYTLYGENVAAQFTMRPGDRRVIQWLAHDIWWWTWDGDEGRMASGMESVGPLYGMVAQIDWASGPEPIISLH